MLEFFKNEWSMFMGELDSFKNAVKNLFGKSENPLMLMETNLTQKTSEKQNQTVETMNEALFEDVEKQEEVKYIFDDIDHKLSAYFGESIEEVRQNMSGDKTQHEVLREYATYFKPYSSNYNMCNCAFKKYYDDKCLEIASGTIPVEQIRIFQNNMDIFTAGQEIFGENEQFIDSRVVDVFERLDTETINKVTNILNHNSEEEVNIQGERLFAEVVSYMVDNKIKIGKDNNILEPVKMVLEEKLNETNTLLRIDDNWDENYQQLLSDYRKYGCALDRIEQYEREIKVNEYEETLNSLCQI